MGTLKKWVQKADKATGGAVSGGLVGMALKGPVGAVLGAVVNNQLGTSTGNRFSVVPADKPKSGGGSIPARPVQPVRSNFQGVGADRLYAAAVKRYESAAAAWDAKYGNSTAGGFSGGSGGWSSGSGMSEGAGGEDSDIASMIDRMFEAGMRTADINMERYPEVTQMALDLAIKTATGLDDAMVKQFEGALDRLYPRWREDIVGAATDAQTATVEMAKHFRENIMPGAMEQADIAGAQAIQNIQGMLRGELPPDVEAQLKRTSAEVAQQIGVRGQAAQYLTARDLGLTSLDMMQQGLAQAPAAFGLTSQVYGILNQTNQMAVESGINVTNLLNAYKAPQTDIANVFGALHAGAVQSTMLTPNAMVGGATSAMQMGAQNLQFAQQRADSLMMFAKTNEMMSNYYSSLQAQRG
jgi:hypothetical protein